MNRDQIIQALEDGATVRHESFPKRWHIKKSGTNYEWESKYLTDIEAFWKTRQSERFDREWSVI